MASSTDLILNQVIAIVEPLTRFDRSSVFARDGSERLLSCKGAWASSIEFTSRTFDGKGGLPSGVHDASSQAGMEREVSRVLSAERSKVIERVQEWCDSQAGLPPSSHAPLTPAVCFSGKALIGFAWECSNCRGHGKVVCSICQGTRQVMCSNCHGAGRTKCYTCNGTGRKNCSLCGGQGFLYVQESKQVYNSATQQYTTVYENKPRQCHQCQGGKVNCTACRGGYNSCFPCHESGKVDCQACHGSGKVTCRACEGSGDLHRVTETACQVTNRFTLRVGDDDAEVQRTLSGWEFPVFCELASVESTTPQITGTELQRIYPATVKLTQARVECAQQEMLLYGYGPEAKVFDFKGIVGNLLSHDLHQLESRLKAPWGFLPFRNQDALRESLSTMLESELNQQLCDKRQKSALIANGAVSEEHASLTLKCLRKAMGRLYRSAAALGLLVLIALVLVALGSLDHFGYLVPQYRLEAVGILLAAAAVVAFVVEFASRRLVLKQFSRSGETELRQAAGRLLRSTGTLLRWRIATALATVAATIGFLLVITR